MRYMFTILLFISFSASAQVWTVWNHTQKLSDKWGLFLDLQLREFDYPGRIASTVVIRPAVQYKISKLLQLSAGYGYFDGPQENDEGRIWEQLRIDNRWKGFSLANQVRLEQRFLNTFFGESYIGHRIRHLIRGDIPFTSDSVFSKGLYAGIQNELFMNLQNGTNGRFIDQNRLFLALGFRLSPKIDIEGGYLNRTILPNHGPNLSEDIIQFRLLTRF